MSNLMRDILDLLNLSFQLHKLQQIPQLVPRNTKFETDQREKLARTQQYFDNSEPWHTPVSQTLAHAGVAFLGTRFPKSVLALPTTLNTVTTVYQNRDQISDVLAEVKVNRGFTATLGVSPSLDFKYIQASSEIGGWMSVDFDTWKVNGGAYFSGEGKTAAKIFNPSFDIGAAGTVFTSSDFDGALEGFYSASSVGYNDYTMTKIKADNGNITGYQLTYDFYSPWAPMANKFPHDPSLTLGINGYGNYFNLNNGK